MAETENPQTDEQDEPRDIADLLHEVYPHFHADKAEKMKAIAKDGGARSSNAMVAGRVEDLIEDCEWRILDFDEGPSAYEWYQMHKRSQLRYEAAISELSAENQFGEERVKDPFHAVADTLRDRVRVHRAHAETAERWLRENDVEVPEVSVDA